MSISEQAGAAALKIAEGICPCCSAQLSFGSRVATSAGPLAPDCCTSCGWIEERRPETQVRKDILAVLINEGSLPQRAVR